MRARVIEARGKRKKRIQVVELAGLGNLCTIRDYRKGGVEDHYRILSLGD